MYHHKEHKLDQKSYGSGIKSSTGNLISIMDNENGLICSDEIGVFQYKTIDYNKSVQTELIFQARGKQNKD